MELNTEQHDAFEIMKTGKSVFLTGSAGTGKSFLTKKFYNYAVNIHGTDRVFKTSSTGVSAILIGGKTLHSWSGIYLGEGTVQEILKKMPYGAREDWRSVKVLFIDEISMIHPNLFDKLENIARILRRNELPFGGIQLVCSGDFFQLSPVSKDKIEKFCFEAASWDSVITHTITLSKIIRQEDLSFQKLLTNMRYGTLSEEDEKLLESRVGFELKNEEGIEPTILFSKNADVNYVNNKRLQTLLTNNKKYEYKSEYKIEYNKTTAKNNSIIEKVSLLSKDLIPDELVMAVGAQVVFKKNLSGTLIANGTRGVITDFKQVDDKGEYYPYVRLLNGNLYLAIREEFEFESVGDYKLIKKQIPIKLAWATTIHSCQGSTLDYVKADIGSSIFLCGQAYVALSRVKNIEGLTLIDFNKSSVKAHPKVLAKYPR
jgi:ATP-dependent DNA helicase PIF1